MDLTIPVHLLVNVPDEVIDANVRFNSRRPGVGRARLERIKTTPAHDGVAVLVGSGPSLGDHIDRVRSLRTAGGVVFAMNGAANFLAKHDLTADYQVLVDARDRTAELIGPAKKHLFASQVDPLCFDKVPDATLWHFINGDLESMLPADEEAHAQIGGAGSVGNCALALAWAMGYRRFELFGYDSSHRDNASHAFHQPLNDFEPWGRFEFKGKEYICSYTMRSQATRFQSIGLALLANGCTLNVHGDGILPAMWAETVRIETTGTEVERERAKYEMAWALPDYRIISPALNNLDEIRAAFGHPHAGSLIDFGCGAGHATKALEHDGMNVLGVDLVNALEADIPFVSRPLWDLNGIGIADYGICCDVMEHIAPERVHDVLAAISEHADCVYFSISTVKDEFGDLIGKPLHLTINPAGWWVEQIGQHWPNVEALTETDIDVRLLARKS